MAGVLILCISGTFALVAPVIGRAVVAARAAARTNECDRRLSCALAAMKSLVDASRISSAAVIERLDETIRQYDPRIDAFLLFAPCGEVLACTYASGPRVEHYADVRLRRDAEHLLPARAALAGHRASGPRGSLIPTDRRALAVPLRDGDQLRAVVYVSSSDDTAIAGEETIVQTIEHAASPYALALEREEDRAHATYDALTGLLTPRAFRTRLSETVDRARLRSHGVFTLWFIDTDRFKEVNDAYGHAAGDGVLQAMADLLRAHLVADVDVAARNGGDEFCALIFDAQKTVAIERAQAFCDAVRRHAFGPSIDLTTSIGVATYPYDARTASELLEVADAAMYHSKRTGRDRVSFPVNGANFSIYR